MRAARTPNGGRAEEKKDDFEVPKRAAFSTVYSEKSPCSVLIFA
jgi:hypothetical protein